MESKRILLSQQGFTLIEIISVLVLIGILAAVAVPKFIDLQADARDKAAEAAVAEGIAQVNLLSAKYILTEGKVPADLAALTSTVGLAAYSEGDFDITFTEVTAGKVTVTAKGKAGTSVALADVSKEIPLPKA